ncbi:MAG: tRNA uridine-5-carboxymethylaminomethyl(34) synthesis enzyme MnmG, partial [Chitinophagaceae bacterium]|nr:tRNA uridine-5-carboxymethylaminomethyl(34) synthesis enzyme MnmG [Chitinophagaceae bacterium]
EPLILKRSEAYIGVLIDDLISKGTNEPYRMFTSRAEFRTLLRQDNADLRLTKLSYKIGLASQERMDRVLYKKNKINNIISTINQTVINPFEINPYFETINSTPITEKQKASKLVLRPSVSLEEMLQYSKELNNVFGEEDHEIIEQAEIQVKYERYIEKEKELVERMSQLEELIIPDTFDYDKVAAISNEALQKFKKIRPRTLGQASRISGVNPSDVQILMVYMGR